MSEQGARSELEGLLDLQEHDTAIDQLRYRRATLPERKALTTLESELATAAQEAAQRGAERDDFARRQRALEADVGMTEAKRATLERQLAAATVPREAQTLSDEIDGLRARQSTTEDELLEIMEATDPVDARLAALAALQADLGERAVVARAELATQEAAVDAEMASLVAEREAAAAAFPPRVLARYERMRAHLGGIAVARLDHGRCTGCNLTLSTAFLEQLRHDSADDLAECENCGRLLVR